MTVNMECDPIRGQNSGQERLLDLLRYPGTPGTGGWGVVPPLVGGRGRGAKFSLSSQVKAPTIGSNNTPHASQRCAPWGVTFLGGAKNALH